MRVKTGPCDSGDRDYIRRRMVNTILQLTSELQCEAKAVMDTVCSLAEERFAPALRFSIDPDASYGRANEQPIRGKRDPRLAVTPH